MTSLRPVDIYSSVVSRNIEFSICHDRRTEFVVVEAIGRIVLGVMTIPEKSDGGIGIIRLSDEVGRIIGPDDSFHDSPIAIPR